MRCRILVVSDPSKKLVYVPAREAFQRQRAAHFCAHGSVAMQRARVGAHPYSVPLPPPPPPPAHPRGRQRVGFSQAQVPIHGLKPSNLHTVPLNLDDWMQDFLVQKIWFLLHLEFAVQKCACAAHERGPSVVHATTEAPDENGAQQQVRSASRPQPAAAPTRPANMLNASKLAIGLPIA